MTIRILLTISFFSINTFSSNKSLDDAVRTAMLEKDGVCIFIDCKSENVITSDSIMAQKRYTPCSTFKIWNTLIGVECGILKSSDEFFYKWDSIPRFLPAWNKDQNLKDAFQVSCVPAFQILAHKIGKDNMKKWIDTLNYGDKDISSGIDDFWLSREGKKSIQISPFEQAQLIKRLVNEELPITERSRNILKEVMLVGKTSKGLYYGKTGSGTLTNSSSSSSKDQKISWFVGYVSSNDKVYSYACLINGANVSSKDSKEIVESIVGNSKLF